MATILLSAAGAAAGTAIGGGALGLSSMIIGRAVGATLGRLIDERLLGGGGGVVETGRVERLRLTGAREGAPVPRLWGRMRLGGQVIWATRFLERVTQTGGGKGGASRPAERRHSYSVSLAIALCEGKIARVGRVWADGTEIDPATLNMRVHHGREEQLPDPRIMAVEGDEAPAYRGIAYVVLEDLELAPFGNRVPQFSFEVIRRAAAPGAAQDLAGLVQGVALIPGAGEYALATTPVHLSAGPGVTRAANLHGPGGQSDIEASLEALGEELPLCRSVGLVVSWFGDDLRAGSCSLRPLVEQHEEDGAGMPWRVAGLGRWQAQAVSRREGRPAYGGTPADASVREAIAALREAGQEVVFYPFLMMDIPEDNTLPDPWRGTTGQPAYPWRGHLAPSPDGDAAQDIAALFGAASPAHFSISGGEVIYSGPEEWSLRRMLLHYAHLCVAAGGVSAFCLGSEMRGLTRARGSGGSGGLGGFPAVAEMCALAADLRAVLGPDVKLGYAADWSEYGGFAPADAPGDLFFPLDPFWAHPAIDFIGIDNYLPLADWRDGEDHLDAAVGSIHDQAYLRGNVEAGEHYDWFYPDAAARAAQARQPITDGAHQEPWVYRAKDIRNWWQKPHHERTGGLRAAQPTAWVPRSKPVWFTELGCPAVDKGANQPNVFLDDKSSDAALPHFSDGRRDDLMQLSWIAAMLGYWAEPGRNPVSEVYEGPMVDLSRALVWAWDARPWPAFPARRDIWSDGAAHGRGHWLTGRTGAQPLGAVIAEICAGAGVAQVETAAAPGLVRGYVVAGPEPARSSLQPLLLAHGVDAREGGGRLEFRRRDGRVTHAIGPADLAEDRGGALSRIRAPEAEMAGTIRLAHHAADGAFEPRLAEARLPDGMAAGVAQSDLPLALTGAEARAIAHRWLAEARVARETLSLSLAPGSGMPGPGDVLELSPDLGGGRWRVDRATRADTMRLEATRVEPGLYRPGPEADDEADGAAGGTRFLPPVPVHPVFLDLPLIRGDEVAHAPHLAVAATPWPGPVAVYASPGETVAGLTLNRLVERGAVLGITETPLRRARPGLFDRSDGVAVRVWGGALASAEREALLAGANLAAIGAGGAEGWELFQFAEAQLVGEGRYLLRLLLRGQAGSDAEQPDIWPAGSTIVLMDGAPAQIDLPAAARGLTRNFRIGAARLAVDDPAMVARAEAFRGIGLRPLSPVHLRLRRVGGDLHLSWIRRGRLDADSWAGMDIPLGEAREAWLVRVMQGETLLREAERTTQAFTYTAAQAAADGAVAPFSLHVAQISESFGPGAFARINVHD
ncbi:MAG: glycoside hydrolase/phage tail family protein [Rhodobacteraceae bacterium]|nr:glycoside hydrolase/phage tail family protein [Paracoccaceae bacterium]